MEYFERFADSLLKEKLEAFGGVLITGPKGCGKTTTAKQFAKDVVEFQDEDKREQYLSVANTKPSSLLIGEKPILFDEWQDAPKIWGAIRKDIDDNQRIGSYILTGSSSQNIKTPHTGTGRISTMEMLPMSLFESKESNGQVSLSNLFNNKDSFEGCKSELSIDNLIFSICRGGWPESIVMKNDKKKLSIAHDIFSQICKKDIREVSKVKRKADIAKRILESYSRHICTTAKVKTIFQDVKKEGLPRDSTLYEYINDLKALHIIDEIESWNPPIRPKTVIRSTPKRNLIDPSIAVAALGLSPKYFNRDFKTLGFLFESLCIRDLKIYSQRMGGTISYYRDRYGLNADCVLHLKDGRYALIEFKLGESEIERRAEHLCEIETLVKEYNKEEKQCPIDEPNLKIIITATHYGYKRDDGVLVIPIGCLRD